MKFNSVLSVSLWWIHIGEIEESHMQDLIFVAITIAFFALSLGYVHFCDRIK
jgi:hypothetical protein